MRTAQGRVKERALYNGILIRQQSDGKKPKQKEKKKLSFFSFNPEFFLCFLFFLVPTD
jgi:hypothetical protein